MDNNRYVAAWNELKERVQRGTQLPVVYGLFQDLLTAMKELEIKHGIPNKEVKDASSQSEQK